MNYLFTSESVSEGHPDKVADQISDSILDEFLRQDPEAKVACETFCTAGLVVVGGEVQSSAYVDIDRVARETIARIVQEEAGAYFAGQRSVEETASRIQSRAELYLAEQG